MDFSDTILRNVDFTGAILQDCFYGTTIMNGNFKGCIIENCAFSETTMKEVDWSNANTGKINFDTVICENCCFDHINFREHQIVECTLTGCTFKKGILRMFI